MKKKYGVETLYQLQLQLLKKKYNMKYLKLFEGGINQDIIDKDYIEMCFEECLPKVKLQYPYMQYKIHDHSGADEEEIRVDLALDTAASVIREPRSWFPL
jgi:hypothetical protein